MSRREDRVRLLEAGVKQVKGPMENEPGGYFCSVPVEAVHFAAYQRPVIDPHVAKIATDYATDAARPLALSLRRGKLWCYDGRQTHAASKAKGLKTLDATVVTGKSYKRECWLFFTHNDAPKQMSSWCKIAAALRAGNRKHKDILGIVRDNNLSTPLDKNVARQKNADVRHPKPLIFCYDRIGEEGLRLYCQIIDKCFRTEKDGPVQEAAKNTDILRGLTLFLKKYMDQIPRRTLFMVLRNITADQITAEAKGYESKGRVDATQYRQAFEGLFIEDGKMAA